jgi:5-methylcytosine-specific restriction endonuclease McrA
MVRAVSKRDGYQCVYTSEAGRRCDARSDLELDHRIPFARGGETTIANLRLLCRPHNLHEAERSYGTEHMRAQQATSRARAVQAKTAQAEARARATASSKQATTIHDATGRQSGSP